MRKILITGVLFLVIGIGVFFPNNLFNKESEILAQIERNNPTPPQVCQLPADIMWVPLSNETWVYRLYKTGDVKKFIIKKEQIG